MDGSLRVGVIGVGHLGSLHAKFLSEIERTILVGVYDLDCERAAAVARHVGTRAFPSLDDLIEACDALTIATPTSTHTEIARNVLSAHRHLFIEKPMTATVAEADELIALANEAGVRIMVGHVERFNPAILALEGYRLDPMFIESHRLAQFNPRGTDVAVVLDLMIHDIDLILSLVHSPIAHIDANGVAVVSQTVDIANARIQFSNGCVANVTASRISQRKMRKMRLFQRDAYISIDFLEGLTEVFRLVDVLEPHDQPAVLLGHIERGAVKRNIVYEQPEQPEVNPLKYEIEQFVAAVQDNRRPPVTAEEARAALAVVEEIIHRIEDQGIAP
ncbi:MAG: Gfo/Idh/MocA family protein [Bacteroidota bacterium]